MTTTASPVERMRARMGAALFARVGGPDGPAIRARVHETPGPRWFRAGSAIRRVHGDSSMYVGGLRALLLQSLHPLAMAGVAGHSGYRGDPWGRLTRTATFLAFTTFGTAEDAQETVDRIRAIHERVRGRASDGRAYRASDPHLLRWVHVAEADSFLAAHQALGQRPLDAAGCDAYVAQSAEVGRRLGATELPSTVAELREAIEGYRPELEASEAALDAADFLLREPPVGRATRVPYAMLASGAVALLPGWARAELGRDRWRTRTFGPAAAGLVTRTIRWGAHATRPARNVD
ncbi:oxygenase MpaB family protein [Demequina sp. SYSU T00192]|uniref:Oxygenase MpaB family protein n=1 Tax=Demequina litoralis TaxID=3051660 RepID=A0ABT8G6C6_9MICO|nr:oxygenase MpaB family protein [Demequina sp. SYSU T00192]MDN4474700.1 oxygenase MpaB family protein [Demequina sp. SYSU T00192]